jgi:hypothetical protein
MHFLDDFSINHDFNDDDDDDDEVEGLFYDGIAC